MGGETPRGSPLQFGSAGLAAGFGDVRRESAVRKPLTRIHQLWRWLDENYFKPFFGGLPRTDTELVYKSLKLC